MGKVRDIVCNCEIDESKATFEDNPEIKLEHMNVCPAPLDSHARASEARLIITKIP
jgi:hypothetical protein